MTVEERMVDRFGHEPHCHTNGCPGLGHCANIHEQSRRSVAAGRPPWETDDRCEENRCTCITAAITAVVSLEVASLTAQILEFHRPSANRRPGYASYCVGCWEEGGEDGAPTWPCKTAQMVQDWS